MSEFLSGLPWYALFFISWLFVAALYDLILLLFVGRKRIAYRLYTLSLPIRRASIIVYLKVFPDRVFDLLGNNADLVSDTWEFFFWYGKLSECFKHAPDEISDLLGADDVTPQNKLAEIVEHAVHFFAARWDSERMEKIVRSALGYRSRYVLVQFELHKKYLVLKTLADSSSVPTVIRRYCARECQKYRAERGACRDQGRKNIVRKIHTAILSRKRRSI